MVTPVSPRPSTKGTHRAWAIWKGRDDYQRPVPGGIYFARVKGSNTLVKRFTVLN